MGGVQRGALTLWELLQLWGGGLPELRAQAPQATPGSRNSPHRHGVVLEGGECRIELCSLLKSRFHPKKKKDCRTVHDVSPFSLYACFDRSQKSVRPLLSCCMSSAAWQMRAARERKNPKTNQLYLIYLWICKHKWCVYYLWICIELDDYKAQYLSSSMACV